MSLTRVTLRLGRNPDAGFPDGNDNHGYVIVAPLDLEGMLDLELWRDNKASCTVNRFSPDPDEIAAYIEEHGSVEPPEEEEGRVARRGDAAQAALRAPDVHGGRGRARR